MSGLLRLSYWTSLTKLVWTESAHIRCKCGMSRENRKEPQKGGKRRLTTTFHAYMLRFQRRSKKIQPSPLMLRSTLTEPRSNVENSPLAGCCSSTRQTKPMVGRIGCDDDDIHAERTKTHRALCLWYGWMTKIVIVGTYSTTTTFFFSCRAVLATI